LPHGSKGNIIIINARNFAKELSISQGKMPPNAVEFEKLVIGTFLIDKKALDFSIDLLTEKVFMIPAIRKSILLF
jgi:hypothetical protein